MLAYLFSNCLTFRVQHPGSIDSLIPLVSSEMNEFILPLPYKTKNETPLYWAAHDGHKDIVELLIKCGASVNVQSDGVCSFGLLNRTSFCVLFEQVFCPWCRTESLIMPSMFVRIVIIWQTRDGHPYTMQRGMDKKTSLNYWLPVVQMWMHRMVVYVWFINRLCELYSVSYSTNSLHSI